MKKTYKMENLDCANCARKMEDAIKKLDGVQNAAVNFMMQKLTLEADAERLPELVKKADACCRKVEPDCRVIF